MIEELVKKSRSYRRFHQDVQISEETLVKWVDLARQSPSGANLQPLKYMLSASEERNNKIFPTLAWAGYLRDWNGPVEGEKPSAYIVILQDGNIQPKPNVDHGIAAQTIMLAATEMGYGGCIIGSLKRKELAKNLQIADHLEILLVLALGKPKEVAVIEPLPESGDIKYWRDEQGVHHVPKRPLTDIILP